MSKKDIDENINLEELDYVVGDKSIDLGELDYATEDENLNLESDDSREEKEIFDEEKSFQKENTNYPFQEKNQVVTLILNESSTNAESDDDIWNNLLNAFRTGKMLSGIIGSVEQGKDEKFNAIVYYLNLQRIVIPASAMNLSDIKNETQVEKNNRHRNILTSMIGVPINFLLKGVDENSRSCVASRTEAMHRQKRKFFINTPTIRKNTVVEAIVVAVNDVGIRVDIFGVETFIESRKLSYNWIGNTREKYHVGMIIKVFVEDVTIRENEDVFISVTVRELYKQRRLQQLNQIKLNASYFGVVEDVVNGTYFIKIPMGLTLSAPITNARRRAKKGDKVSCIITNIDKSNLRVFGTISKIIKSN